MKIEKRNNDFGSFVQCMIGHLRNGITNGKVIGIIGIIGIIFLLLLHNNDTTSFRSVKTITTSTTATTSNNQQATVSSALLSSQQDRKDNIDDGSNSTRIYQQRFYKQEEWYTIMLGKISDTCKHISHLFHHFLPHQQCQNIIRIGKCDDGSKLICMDHFVTEQQVTIDNRKNDEENKSDNTNNNPQQATTTTTKIQSKKLNTRRAIERNERCVIYSFGSSDDSCFESDIASKTDCEIHIFDPTSKEIHHPRWTYHSYGLTGHDPNITTYWNWRTQRQATCTNCPMKTLADIMIELNHTYIDILKIDIDGAEWRSFEHVYDVIKTLPATQIQLELTGLDITDENDSLAGKTVGVYKLWENLLNDNYVIFHIEANQGTCRRSKSRSASFEYALMKRQQ